jgi:error-prone DNA polymerase
VRARTGLDRNRLEQLVRSGAMDTLEPHRRRALFACGTPLGQLRLTLGREVGGQDDDLGDVSEQERHQMEVEVLGFEWRPSVWQRFRPRLRRLGYAGSAEVRTARAGQRVRCVGWPFRPHRPPTRSGRPAAFFSLVDEEGLVDCVIFGTTYERQGGVLFTRPVPPLEVEGTVTVRGEGREVVVRRVRPWLGFPAAERYDRSRLPGSAGDPGEAGSTWDAMRG